MKKGADNAATFQNNFSYLDLNTKKDKKDTDKYESKVENTIKREEEQPKNIFNPYTVKIIHPCLRIRKGPSTSEQEVGLITDQGNYTILEEQNGFGKLKDNQWIMLLYTSKVEI